MRALDGVDLTVGAGEFVSIIGPSGSGKSTLLHVLGALDRPDEGELNVAGVDIVREKRLDRVRAQSIGFVFQLHHLVPTLTATENVELPLYSLDVPRAERRRRALELLDALELGERATHRPNQLSGGQRQRVAIARALVNEPKLVLADEPTGDLDRASGQQVMQRLTELQRDRALTLILVTHDLEIAHSADRVVSILDGKIVDDSAGDAKRAVPERSVRYS